MSDERIEELKQRAIFVAMECELWPEDERAFPPTTIRGLAAHIELISIEMESVVLRNRSPAPLSPDEAGAGATGTTGRDGHD